MSARSLADIQRWFQSVVTHPDGVAAGAQTGEALRLAPLSRSELEAVVTASSKLSAHDRLSIYAHAYYARLIECLGESFPALKQTLGEEVFNGFAFGYLQEHPSRSYTLGRLADRFVDYLQATRPALESDGARWPDFLIDLARLEWTIGDVFDGPGIEHTDTLNAEELAAIPPDQWGAIKLETAPCLRLLSCAFPVNEYYSALRYANDVSAKPNIPDAADTYVAITRRHYIVRRHELSPTQFVLLEKLQAGETVIDAIEHAALCGQMAESTLLAQLPEWFAGWTQQQFFVSFTLTR